VVCVWCGVCVCMFGVCVVFVVCVCVCVCGVCMVVCVYVWCVVCVCCVCGVCVYVVVYDVCVCVCAGGWGLNRKSRFSSLYLLTSKIKRYCETVGNPYLWPNFCKSNFTAVLTGIW